MLQDHELARALLKGLEDTDRTELEDAIRKLPAEEPPTGRARTRPLPGSAAYVVRPRVRRG